MARGDVTVFQEANAYLIDGGWEPGDDIKCAVLDNTLAPTAADVTPTLAEYTEVGVAGTYVAGGLSLGNLGACVVQSGAVMTFDSATNPNWLQDASNDVDAYWGFIYHVLTTLGIAFVELAGPVDMQAGDLTITWNASGIFTVTIT